MDRSGLQRLVPIILVVIVIIVAVAALVSVGRTLFGDGGGSSPTPSVNSGKEELTNTSADRSVQMVYRGPITASETARSYSITVSPNGRNMTTYKGYIGDQIGNEQLDNNVAAYTQFVNALSRAKLMDGTPLSGEENDLNGVCANGFVYEFSVMQGTKTIQKLWTSTCKGSKGSLTASLSQVSRLFRVQIPDYNTMISKADING